MLCSGKIKLRIDWSSNKIVRRGIIHAHIGTTFKLTSCKPWSFCNEYSGVINERLQRLPKWQKWF